MEENIEEETNESTIKVPLEPTVAGKLKGRPWIVVVAAGGGLLLVVAVAAFWYLFLNGRGGEPVPVPRDTNFASGTGDESRTALASDRELELSEEQLDAARLEFAVVGEAIDGNRVVSTTAGVIKANEYASTPVNALAGGVVKSVFAKLGNYVRKGEVIAIVSSESLASAQSDLLKKKAALREAENRYERAVSLSSISDEAKGALDTATARYASTSARLAEKESDFNRSQKLVKIGAISKKAFEMATTEFESAKAEHTEAKLRVDRARKLLEIDPARKNELDRFFTEVATARSDVAAMKEMLIVLGLSRRSVDGLNRAENITASLPIRSPISGTLTERSVNGGEVVSADTKIGEVTDLSKVWVIGQVYEKDLGKVKVGSGASITSDSYPGEVFRGTVTYVDPSLDESTRTAQVRTEIVNPAGKLKLSMYVDVALAVVEGSEKTVPVVPKAAVQKIGGDAVVFLPKGDSGKFLIRAVRLGDETDGGFPVIEGLFVGDKVVTTGSFLLKAEWLKMNPSGS